MRNLVRKIFLLLQPCEYDQRVFLFLFFVLLHFWLSVNWDWHADPVHALLEKCKSLIAVQTFSLDRSHDCLRRQEFLDREPSVAGLELFVLKLLPTNDVIDFILVETLWE